MPEVVTLAEFHSKEDIIDNWELYSDRDNGGTLDSIYFPLISTLLSGGTTATMRLSEAGNTGIRLEVLFFLGSDC